MNPKDPSNFRQMLLDSPDQFKVGFEIAKGIRIDGDFLVIYEVKARSTDAFGEPELFVTRKKQRFLVTAAAQYIEEKGLELEVRFDILAILAINNNFTVKHLKSAFYPEIK